MALGEVMPRWTFWLSPLLALPLWPVAECLLFDTLRMRARTPVVISCPMRSSRHETTTSRPLKKNLHAEAALCFRSTLQGFVIIASEPAVASQLVFPATGAARRVQQSCRSQPDQAAPDHCCRRAG
jgi:hypothetical protein